MLRVYHHHDQKTAIQFLDYLLERLPFGVESIQTDNGAEFQSAFHWHVLDRGIQHVYIKPATPRLNGKVERSHRIDAEEFYRLLDGVVLDDAQLFATKLQEWEDFYNFHRPHGGSGAKLPTSDCAKRPKPLRNRPSSVAQLARQRSRIWPPRQVRRGTSQPLSGIGAVTSLKSKESTHRSRHPKKLIGILGSVPRGHTGWVQKSR